MQVIWCVLCISTSFWVLRTPECWSKRFFTFFKLFCSFLTFMSDFLPEIKKKHLKINKKKYFSYFISGKKSQIKVQMNKKDWKRPKKCFEKLSGVRSTWVVVKIRNRCEKKREQFINPFFDTCLPLLLMKQTRWQAHFLKLHH